MEVFAYKWFTVYYFMISALFSIQGLVWLFNPNHISDLTRKAIQENLFPKKAIRIIKYLFLFSLISFILSFFPFNWARFVYSIWIFVMIFISGRFFLHWENFCEIWKTKKTGLERFYQRLGGFFLGIGIATFLVLYFSVFKPS